MDDLRKMREENKKWRLKASENEKAALEASEAAKKASEEAQAAIAEHANKTEQRLIRSELKAVALKAGIVDLDGLKLVDMKDVKLNPDGEVEGADAAIEALRKAKPYLFTKTTSSTQKPPEGKPPTTKKATEMTPEEYKAEKRRLGYA